MRIKRNLAIGILKYLHKHPKFYFPFLVMCKEYTPEDDDFVEIEPNEWQLIQSDKTYQIFELRENLQHLYKWTTELLAKWFIEKIIWENLYKEELCESKKIEEYWENEFFWWKAEAYGDILKLLEKYKI